MKNILGILIMLFVLIACGENQKSIADYESYKVKFAKEKFYSNNGEFSILLPKNWFHNEDSIDSDTVLYTLESGSKDSNFVAMGVMKMNIITTNIETEFEYLIKQITDRANNVTIVEKSEMKFGNKTAKTALLTYEHNEKITQEELDFFIPINDTQYYYLGGVSDKNENIENNFGMIIYCVKSFKLNK